MKIARFFLGLLFVTAGCGDSKSTTDAAPPTDVTADDRVTTDVVTVVDASGDVVMTDAAMDAARDVAADTTTTDVASDDGATTADAAPVTCGTLRCAATEFCILSRTVGGAVFFPDDAGMCPVGRHPEGGFCVSDFSYACAPRPTCAMDGCSCSRTLCQTSYTCTSADVNQLTCVQMAP